MKKNRIRMLVAGMVVCMVLIHTFSVSAEGFPLTAVTEDFPLSAIGQEAIAPSVIAPTDEFWESDEPVASAVVAPTLMPEIADPNAAETMAYSSSEQYFIASQVNGFLFTISQPYMMSYDWVSMSNLGTLNHAKWVFTGSPTEGYVISLYGFDTCLSVNSSGQVVISAQAASGVQQHWKVQSGYLVLYAPGNTYNGYRLAFHYNAGSATYSTVLNTTGTKIGVVTATNYVAPTAISLKDRYVKFGEAAYMNYSVSPASCTANNMLLQYQVYSSQITVYNDGMLRGGTVEGSYTVTVKDMLTNVAASAKLHVAPDYSGDYLMFNLMSGMYANAHPSRISTLPVTQEELSGEATQRFKLVYLSYGYYAIRAVDSINYLTPQQYLAADSSQPINNRRIIAVTANNATAVGDNGRWRIEKVTDTTQSPSRTYFRFVPRNMDDAGQKFAIGISTANATQSGQNLQMRSYTATGSDNTLWVMAEIEAILDVERVGQERSNLCWAACGEMYAKYYYPDSSITQSSLVSHYNEGVNVPKDLTDTANVINIQTEGPSIARGLEETYCDEVLLQTVLGMEGGGAIILARGRYGKWNLFLKENGHQVVLFGHVVIDGIDYYLMHDPTAEGIVFDGDSIHSTNSDQTRLMSYEFLRCSKPERRQAYDPSTDPQDDNYYNHTEDSRTIVCWDGTLMHPNWWDEDQQIPFYPAEFGGE